MSSRQVKRKRTDSSDSSASSDSSSDSNLIPTNPVIEFSDFIIDIVADPETIWDFEEKFGVIDSDSDFNNIIRDVVLTQRYIEVEDSQATISMSDGGIERSEESDHENEYDNSFPRVGNRVSVAYTPASQKYIDHYNSQAFSGTVFFVDPDRQNFFMWTCEPGPMIDGKISLTYRVQSYKREGCHFFGMTDGYFGHFQYY